MTAQQVDARPFAAALAENIDAFVQCASPSGELLFVNRAWRARLGYTADDLQTRRVRDIVSISHRARSARQFETLFAGGDVGAMTSQLVARDGTVVDVEGSLTRVVVDGSTIASLAILIERPASPEPPFSVPVGRQIVLTERQRAVLQLFASGHTTKQVAARLDIAVKTVHNHLTTIYRVLDAQSLVQATMIAAHLGIVELAGPHH